MHAKSRGRSPSSSKSSRFSSGLGSLLELVVFILWLITFIGVCKGQRKVAPIVGGIQILK